MQIADLDTPAMVIDQAIAMANLQRMQALADQHGVVLRHTGITMAGYSEPRVLWMVAA